MGTATVENSMEVYVKSKLTKNQDGSGQALSMHGLLLLPHILQIHGYVTAKITYSTAHTCHNVPAWPRTTFVL